MKLLWLLVFFIVAGHSVHRMLPPDWFEEEAWPQATAPLQHATAALTAWTVGGERDGSLITVGRDRFEITPACSGFRKLLLLEATALIIAWALPVAWTAGLMLALVPVTVALNSARVVAIVWLQQHVSTAAAQGWWHEAIGMAGYGVILVAVLSVSGWVARRPRRP